MTLRARMLVMVTLLLVGGVLVVGVILTLSARQAILTQQEQDGLLVARLLARTISTVEEFPQEMENAIGDQMVVEATIAAHLVAIAELAGLTPDEINAHLAQITDSTVLNEFWITDQTGHAYLRNIASIDFSFSPDPEEQPQASVFWGLITGETDVVVQEARQREVDTENFKYVGVAGIDQPRIVQVGYNAGVLSELRQRVGVKRLIDGLVAGGDVSGIHVVDNETTTLVFSGAPGIGLIELTERDTDRLKLVLENGEETVHLEGGYLKVIVPIRESGEDEAVIGAVLVYMPTDLLQAVMRQQIWQAALAALFVLAVGVVASTFLSRRVTKPVSAIARAASAVQTGEYKSARLSQVLARHDELGKLGKVFDQMAREVMAREQRMHMLRKVIPIGVSLSAEKDFNRLLETIVVESQNITHADGGTLYLLEGKQLRFFILRNTSLNLAIGGTTGAPIPFAPLELYDESGQPNHHHVATHVALSRQRINIPDAYETEEFDFSGTKTYDSTTGYRSKSFLTIPIEGEAGEIIGVLQLINSLDPETGEVVAFISDEVLETLVLLATTALNAYLRQEALRKEIERLNIAIDEKQRSRQVDEITDTDYFRSLLSSVKKFRKTDESGEQDEGSEE